MKKGQVMRLPSGQTARCGDYNANDYKEWFHIGQSWAINVMLGTGTPTPSSTSTPSRHARM